MYEFWYDYVKLKYGENTKLCHIDTHSFIVHVKTDDINKDLTLQTLSQKDHCLKKKIKNKVD